MRCHTSLGSSAPPGVPIPALEQKRSIPPYLLVATATRFAISDSTATLVLTAIPPMLLANDSARSRSRSAITTPRAPSALKRSHNARPIPLAPPVTTATLSLSFIECLFVLFQFQLCYCFAVNLVGAICKPQCSGTGPSRSELKVLTNSPAAASLDRPIDYPKSHAWGDHFYHRNLGSRRLVADCVHHVSRFQREQPGLFDLHSRSGDVGADRSLLRYRFPKRHSSTDAFAHCFESPLRQPYKPHTMMDAAWTEASLGD